MNITDTESLSEKVVINLCNGKNLGYICDVRFAVDDGKIVAIIVLEEQGLFSFGKGSKLVIPWDKIECIGEDSVLVKLSVGDSYQKDGGDCGCSKARPKYRFPWC